MSPYSPRGFEILCNKQTEAAVHSRWLLLTVLCGECARSLLMAPVVGAVLHLLSRSTFVTQRRCSLQKRAGVHYLCSVTELVCSCVALRVPVCFPDNLYMPPLLLFLCNSLKQRFLGLFRCLVCGYLRSTAEIHSSREECSL